VDRGENQSAALPVTVDQTAEHLFRRRVERRRRLV
jgi:stalled ribosome alternative rescue factor ArfA